MEQLLEVKSIPALMVVIVVFMALHLVKGIAEFLWKMKEKQDTASETAIKELTEGLKKNTLAMEHLDDRIEGLEEILTELPKFKLDMRRMYTAIKYISGDKWAKIRKDIMEDTNL